MTCYTYKVQIDHHVTPWHTLGIRIIKVARNHHYMLPGSHNWKPFIIYFIRRFAPTRAPAPWDDIKTVDTIGPVCPQRLPDISNETLALERMPKGRLEYLRRLLPRLKNQSEDCLYMNIYTPVQGEFVRDICEHTFKLHYYLLSRFVYWKWYHTCIR